MVRLEWQLLRAADPDTNPIVREAKARAEAWRAADFPYCGHSGRLILMWPWPGPAMCPACQILEALRAPEAGATVCEACGASRADVIPVFTYEPIATLPGTAVHVAVIACGVCREFLAAERPKSSNDDESGPISG